MAYSELKQSCTAERSFRHLDDLARELVENLPDSFEDVKILPNQELNLSYAYSCVASKLREQVKLAEKSKDHQKTKELTAKEKTLTAYEEALLTIRQQARNEKTTLADFTRKSIVGAIYRVGASFTMDAIYLSLASATAYYAREHQPTLDSLYHSFSDFITSLDPGKLARVAGFVVAINFADYKFDITNRLDRTAKKIFNLEKRAD